MAGLGRNLDSLLKESKKAKEQNSSSKVNKGVASSFFSSQEENSSDPASSTSNTGTLKTTEQKQKKTSAKSTTKKSEVAKTSKASLASKKESAPKKVRTTTKKAATSIQSKTKTKVDTVKKEVMPQAIKESTKPSTQLEQNTSVATDSDNSSKKTPNLKVYKQTISREEIRNYKIPPKIDLSKIEIEDIFIDNLIESDFFPRINVTPERLQAELDSFYGLEPNDRAPSFKMETLFVRPSKEQPGKYEILWGVLYYRLAKKEGLDFLPCYVLDVDDVMAYVRAFNESIYRNELNIIEQAKAIEFFIEFFCFSKAKTSELFEIKTRKIDEFEKLLTLEKEVQDALIEKKITLSHAALLSTVPQGLQYKACLYLLENNFNAKQSRFHIDKFLQQNDPNRMKSDAQKNDHSHNAIYDLYEKVIASRLEEVDPKFIKEGNANKGKLVLSFKNIKGLTSILNYFQVIHD